MKRIATSMIAAGATAAAAVVLVGCGSSDTSQVKSTTASTTVQREAASKPAPERCPERYSLSKELTIVNKTESVLYPSAENWRCDDWSGWGNPSVLNGWAIGPGQKKVLRLEPGTMGTKGVAKFTINFRFGTNIALNYLYGYPQMDGTDGVRCRKMGQIRYSKLFPGRFGPNTVRATIDCTESEGTGIITLESVPPKEPPA